MDGSGALRGAPGPLMRTTPGLLLLLALASCKAPETGALPEEPSPEEPRAVEAPIPLENRVVLARVALGQGDYQKVLSLLADGDPLAPQSARTEQALLRTEAHRHLLQSEVVDAWIECAQRTTLGDALELRLVLANVGTEALVIKDRPGNGASPSTLRIEASCREWPADGAFVEHRLTRSLELGSDVLLDRAGRFAARCALDTLEIAADSPTLRTYDIKAVLHTAGLQAGTARHLAAIQFRPVRVLVLPKNWEPLAAAPLLSLREAVKRRAILHLPVIAALMPAADVDASRRILVSVRDGADEVLADAAGVALGLLGWAAASGSGLLPREGGR